MSSGLGRVAAARLAHVIRSSGSQRRRGELARRTITVVFDENLSDEEYADFGNGLWGS